MNDSDYKLYAPGDIVFSQGQPGDVMYIVKEGEVEIRLGEKVLDTIGPDGFFGEMALIDDAPEERERSGENPMQTFAGEPEAIPVHGAADAVFCGAPAQGHECADSPAHDKDVPPATPAH